MKIDKYRVVLSVGVAILLVMSFVFVNSVTEGVALPFFPSENPSTMQLLFNFILMSALAALLTIFIFIMFVLGVGWIDWLKGDS